MNVIKCTVCGGQLLEQGNIRRCKYCNTTFEIRNRQLDDDLRFANTFRECARFDEAKALYEKILSQYPDEDLGEVHWNLLLCEHNVMFETNERGERFPSFYAINTASILDSDHYKEALKTDNDALRAKFVDLAEKMQQVKHLYERINSTSKPFDIFICFKKTASDGKDTPDTDLATDIYNNFAKDYNIFFSEKSLKNVAVREFEPNIYYALYTAKVMIILCSKKEYVESQWVKNEWSRYCSFANHGGSDKTIIPIFIDDFSPRDLPSQLASYQGFTDDRHIFADLEKTLKNIISPIDQEAYFNQLKAEQAKQAEEQRKMLLEQQKKMEALQKQINQTSTEAEGVSDVSTLQSHANMFLNEKNWSDAKRYFERILDIDPKNVDAYLGKLLVENEVTERRDLLKSKKALDKSESYKKIIEYGDEKLKAELIQYNDEIKSRIKKARIRTGIIGGATVFSIICITLIILTFTVFIPNSQPFVFEENGEGYTLKAINKIDSPDVVIPETYNGKPVTYISSQLFLRCKDRGSIKSITIPDSVTFISYGAFWDCTNVESIKGPVLNSEGFDIFGTSGVPDSLREIIITDGTDIESCEFYNHDSLTYVVIPNSVTVIEDAAFAHCSNLTSVVIGRSVSVIRIEAFGYCDRLEYIYYFGTSNEWNNIEISDGSGIEEEVIYYYSETEPTVDGNYWRYVNDVPTVWE